MFKELIFLALLAYASAAPQRYQGNYQQQPPQQGPPPQYAQQPPQGPPPQYAQQGPPPQGAQQGPPQGPPPQPVINWNRCPQLEPSMEDKIKKSSVINKCLEMTPVPENITRETVEQHREQVAGCALQYEGWFNEQGLYRFDKAESEIRAKKLSSDIEPKVIAYHNQCKNEANEKFPPKAKNVIAQVQLYQACMDYFISEVCGIEVSIPGLPPQPANQAGQQGPPPQHGHQHPPRQYQ